jgi:fibronectin type 3 domain-containing protein
MAGKVEVVAARVRGPEGRNVGWSNTQDLTLVPPLPVPAGLDAKDAPDAVHLEWHAAASQFRVFRKSSDEPDWKQIATVDKPLYVDSGIEYGKTYEYQVQSIEKSGDKYAESEASKAITFKPADKFPPAVPVGLTVVPGTRSIELVWERNLEKDLAGYRVYRDGMKVGPDVTSPSWSDKDVKPGTRYSYQVSAVDTAGNESARSAPGEAALP